MVKPHESVIAPTTGTATILVAAKLHAIWIGRIIDSLRGTPHINQQRNGGQTPARRQYEPAPG